jgi:hypothetical protein
MDDDVSREPARDPQTRLDAWRRLSTVCRASVVGYFGQSSDTGYLRCRPLVEPFVLGWQRGARFGIDR